MLCDTACLLIEKIRLVNGDYEGEEKEKKRMGERKGIRKKEEEEEGREKIRVS